MLVFIHDIVYQRIDEIDEKDRRRCGTSTISGSGITNAWHSYDAKPLSRGCAVNVASLGARVASWQRCWRQLWLSASMLTMSQSRILWATGPSRPTVMCFASYYGSSLGDAWVCGGGSHLTTAPLAVVYCSGTACSTLGVCCSTVE
jgi:hypothetical protein